MDIKLANEYNAKTLLNLSDWVEYPSTSDVTKTPHLVNLDEWINYRVALRAIAVNAPDTPIVMPQTPEKIWSN